MPSGTVVDRDSDQGNPACNAQEEAEPMSDRTRKLFAANVNLLLRHDCPWLRPAAQLLR
ncbi:hypothetical protein SBA1_990027 [Candidatus Sulfotelmatobacter kueseliae]|uniref:Uncharacterized protein n=1 Tax=Candidatus Sulfotelmatobacter kueseliae TaxID=2042962 RepID=A0A2U3LEI1_9BACT|nr:hypothetical protein SBA1_990027 [Candidatus Sulfotelmatobacter kueseliae]